MILLVAIPAGLLIGAVGIGGVLLPPALIRLSGLDPHTAAGTAGWSFLFTSVVGVAVYARKRPALAPRPAADRRRRAGGGRRRPDQRHRAGLGSAAGNGQIRYGLGSLLGLVSGAAVVAGAALAGRLPQHRLRQAASATLVAVGVLLFATLSR